MESCKLHDRKAPGFARPGLVLSAQGNHLNCSSCAESPLACYQPCSSLRAPLRDRLQRRSRVRPRTRGIELIYFIDPARQAKQRRVSPPAGRSRKGAGRCGLASWTLRTCLHPKPWPKRGPKGPQASFGGDQTRPLLGSGPCTSIASSFRAFEGLPGGFFQGGF